MENEKSIIDIILSLSRSFRRNQQMRQEISIGKFKILKILNNEGTMRTSDLAELLNIRPPSLTEKLVKMEEHGYINREKDKIDSRITLISLTSKGTRALTSKKEDYDEIEKRLQNVLTIKEQQEFSQICAKLIQFFEAEIGNEPSKHQHSRGNPL